MGERNCKAGKLVIDSTIAVKEYFPLCTTVGVSGLVTQIYIGF